MYNIKRLIILHKQNIMKILSRIPVILSAIIMLCALNNTRAQLTVNIKVNEIPYSVGMDPFCNAPLELSFYDFQIGENPMDPQPTEVEKVQWVVNGATLVIGDGVTPMPLEDGFITISPNLGQNSVQVTVWADNKEYVIRNSARIDVIENATAEFTATPACANSETEFINQSQNAGSYLWSFGDGTSSTELTPGHLYTTPGTYTVILKAYTTDGTCYDMVSHTVEVYDNAPQAAFTTEDVCLGYPVQFINQSTGADSYTWTFSCPAIPYESSTTQPNPSHFFAVAETYTVELVATNSCASSTITSQVTVMDGVGSVLIGAPAVACEDVQVDFTATTVAGASYNWSFGDGVTSTDQNPSHTFTIAGNYTVMLEVDDGTCSNTFSHYVIVSAIPLAGVNVSGNTTICEGEATTLEANIYNQTPGESYTYEWSLNGNILGTQPTIGVTQGGVYLLTVYGNCEYDVAQSPYIIVNPVPVASMSTDAPAACADYNNGTATVTSDDPGDYTYAWSNSASTTATANDLFSGTNFVTVTNTFGCNTMVNTYIPAQNMVLSASTTPTDCNVDNGTAQVSVTSGGNGSYDYAWSSGGDNNQETGLGVGAYSVTVTDSYGCIAVKNNINVGTYILNVTVQTTDIACGTTTATITANVSAQGYNPETPLTWTWYDANTGNPVSGLPNSNVVDLPAGDYYAEVSDNNSCSGESADFSVLDDEPLSLTSTSQDVSCPGDIDGAIQIQTKSGVGPFTYDWSTGEHVSDISGLAPGAYTVTVTDANGCIAELTVTINEPTPLSFTGQYINCQALLTGGGGTPGYQFEWYQVETPDDPPQTVNILEATTSVNFMAGLIGGQYMVSVTDASGCVFETDPFTVNARPEVRIIPIEFRYVEPVISDPPPSEEVIPEIIMTADDAQDALNDAYDACMASCNDDITSALNKSCLSDKAVKDVFSINYDLDYYHYTLYYYDRAGNLVTTVPPEGVDILDVNDPVEGEDILNRLVHPNHTMKTTCEYNSLNQTIKTTTPDGGATVFLYDELGRRRFSQNAEQALTTNNSYSYIKYDDLGRTIEVGECSQNESDLFDGSTPDLSEYADNFPQIGCTNVHRTIYSKLSDIDYFGEPQEHLLNRISYVITDRDGDFSTDNDQVVTYYSYDVHGNVKWLVQDLPGFTKNYIAYEYDLYSGNVLLVKYNEMRPDRFFHKYKYNADNNITDVYTSRDGYLWYRDANYEYTEFGEVDRIHIGDDNIQGLDYTYNRNGWLKAINQPDLEASWDPSTGAEPVDPGADGFAGSDMPYDVFGMTLGYYE
ncbi:MAG: hypothetical protein C0594_14900 [Marinilabiliales bacterium]|nr:MAG: hypothetical protein C0594_14900 [Marinilabiliales bacterium]